MIDEKFAETIDAEEAELHRKFERWLKLTGEPFDDWEYDGENYLVYAAGREAEIYEPALVRELVREMPLSR